MRTIIEVKIEPESGVVDLIKDTWSGNDKEYRRRQREFEANFHEWSRTERIRKFVQLNKVRPGLHLSWIPF